jgi:hypothetical protein
MSQEFIRQTLEQLAMPALASAVAGNQMPEVGRKMGEAMHAAIGGLVDGPAQPVVAQPIAFDARYRHTNDFGAALSALKSGRTVARKGWNGKGQFVYLVPAASYPAQTGAAKSHFGEGAMVPYNAYLALKGADNTVSTWAPSGSDALADDWYIVE